MSVGLDILQIMSVGPAKSSVLQLYRTTNVSF